MIRLYVATLSATVWGALMLRLGRLLKVPDEVKYLLRVLLYQAFVDMLGGGHMDMSAYAQSAHGATFVPPL